MKAKQSSWWKKLITLIGLINLILVIFNLSYLSLRDTYLHRLPSIVKIYDPVKGIEPHPDTEAYLQTANLLQQAIATQGLAATSTEQLLGSLRQQSLYLIEENPFLTANKSSTFAKLKHRVEYRLQTRSAKEAFSQFWSREHLSKRDLESELTFFNHKIKPLLETNYYRGVNANGIYIDNFWRIDIFFIIFFAIEYLGRTFWLAKNDRDLNWWDAMLRYWYGALMLIPVWRWLRIIPVTIYIHKSGLFNLERIIAQITHEPAAYISERASLFIIVRLLNQSQEVINDGTLANLLLSSGEKTKVGETDKINIVIDRLISLTVFKVLPEVQPDLENLLHYSLKGALKESDVYQTIKAIPGITNLPREAIEQLADYLSQTAYEVLINSYTDAQGKIIFDRLKDNFASTLKKQLQDRATQAEIQILLSDIIEEWKLNYVKASQQSDPEATIAETEKIKSEVQS
ncbi:MAG: hypothetical protein QNJ72_30500 [Pleurocapsa sp. MO_226.B13]|nr:hypothetical protein [Pleurocapsa sp. MO_226.B13]